MCVIINTRNVEVENRKVEGEERLYSTYWMPQLQAITSLRLVLIISNNQNKSFSFLQVMVYVGYSLEENWNSQSNCFTTSFLIQSQTWGLQL